YKPIPIDAEKKNNDYVVSLISKVLEIKSIKNKKLVIWPYLDKARGIVTLFKRLGADIILIDEEINPPNPIKELRENKLKQVMESEGSEIAILLDADRDRIALYVKQNGEYNYYIPNEIYSALHNILAKDYQKKIINVRTIPSDLRGDDTSFINILTGVGYKHLGVILYFLLGIEVDKSKVDKAILYFEDENNNLRKIDNALTLYSLSLIKMVLLSFFAKLFMILIFCLSTAGIVLLIPLIDQSIDFEISWPRAISSVINTRAGTGYLSAIIGNLESNRKLSLLS
ncbi:unnamed protein product, partial [marine sediment metagenome]